MRLDERVTSVLRAREGTDWLRLGFLRDQNPDVWIMKPICEDGTPSLEGLPTPARVHFYVLSLHSHRHTLKQAGMDSARPKNGTKVGKSINYSWNVDTLLKGPLKKVSHHCVRPVRGKIPPPDPSLWHTSNSLSVTTLTLLNGSWKGNPCTVSLPDMNISIHSDLSLWLQSIFLRVCSDFGSCYSVPSEPDILFNNIGSETHFF